MTCSHEHEFNEFKIFAVIDSEGIPNEKNPGDLGRLWIELLQFYSRENVFKNVISLTADGYVAQETNEAKIIIEGVILLMLLLHAHR